MAQAEIKFGIPGRIGFSGSWRYSNPRPTCESVLLRCHPENGKICLVDDGIEEWDSTLLIVLAQIIRELREADIAVSCDKLPAGAVRLLKLSDATSPLPAKASYTQKQRFIHLCGFFGLGVWGKFMQVSNFVGEIVLGLTRCVKLTCRMRGCDLRRELVNCGPSAVAIVSLISFLMGLIMAFIGAIPLRWFQAENYVASLVGIGMLRLLAPVMVGIVMAGRTGAAYAAELGTMTVNEEVDALRTLGVPPVDFLVMPRFLSLTILAPLLCVFADLVSILGGAVVAICYLGLSPLSYFSTLTSTTRPNDLVVGLVTALILGMLDAICGCYHGIQCGRSAAAVGKATTAAVVSSIICIVIATSLITVITVVLSI
jgi:phospholipid/cholesterol/gamma-HCH transport system permease protein